MKCKNCGFEIEPGKYVCPECATPVQIVPDFNEFEESLNEMVGEDDSADQPDHGSDFRTRTYSGRSRTSAKRQKPKSHKGLIILGILVVLIIGGCLLGLSAYRMYREKNFSVEYQLDHARDAVRERDMVTAIAFYNKAIELAPDDKGIIRELADFYRGQNDSEKAIVLYQQLLTASPKSLELFTILFDMYEEEGDLDRILAFREQACTPDQRELFLPYGISEPAFSIAGGDFEEYIKVELFADPGLDIYYVINGNDPSEQGVLYNDAIELEEEGTYIISAVSKNDKEMYSSVVSNIYTISIPAPESPSLTPDGGDFVFQSTVFVSVPENCTAYYTWNGKNPDTDSKQVKGVISVPEGNHILSVIAVDDRTGKKSDVYSARFTYYPQIEEPDNEDGAEGDSIPEDKES